MGCEFGSPSLQQRSRGSVSRQWLWCFRAHTRCWRQRWQIKLWINAPVINFTTALINLVSQKVGVKLDLLRGGAAPVCSTCCCYSRNHRLTKKNTALSIHSPLTIAWKARYMHTGLSKHTVAGWKFSSNHPCCQCGGIKQRQLSGSVAVSSP